MASFDERFETLAQRGIEKAIEDERAILEAGQLPTHSDYKYHCGIIAGLRMAQAFLSDALATIQKG